GVRSSSCTAASARIWSRLGRFTVMGDADFFAGVGRRVGAGSARDEACGGRVGRIVPKVAFDVDARRVGARLPAVKSSWHIPEGLCGPVGLSPLGVRPPRSSIFALFWEAVRVTGRLHPPK